MFLVLDAIRMIQDIRQQGAAIGAWGAALNIPQLIGGVLFIWTIEGLLILVAEVIALAIAGQIHKRDRFSRLIGICHIPWLALLPWLIYRLINFDHWWLLKVWITYVVVTILISLIFDLRDVYKYWRGDRTFTWAE